ncbi:alpha/beta fold hydrolase [Salsipaludibacter albus]|uniref:alpha/beta fold hydrolase n=1 Tax=Salsipaludibacter albus TaxID=2849650 RepID=UPI001EE4D1D8|nr:alpha/beta hydrolase [Salsipaludibacter albus]
MADIILVPGLWLDGASWDAVLPSLDAAGHRTHPLTLPGMESPDADRSGVTLRDHVAAVVAAIDGAATDGPIVVVGHSAGSGIAWAAVDARPDRVDHLVVVGGFPTPDGRALAPYFTANDVGEIPLPPWSEFDDADLDGLDDDLKADFADRALPSPANVTTDPQELSDPRRYDVPVTAVCPEYTTEQLRSWIDDGEESVAEFTRIHDVTYVDLPTGHWPQFTRPDRLARTILAAVSSVEPADGQDDDQGVRG